MQGIKSGIKGVALDVTLNSKGQDRVSFLLQQIFFGMLLWRAASHFAQVISKINGAS